MSLLLFLVIVIAAIYAWLHFKQHKTNAQILAAIEALGKKAEPQASSTAASSATTVTK